MKELYSFDVFDTLITRACAQPKGIFAIMQHTIQRNRKAYGVSEDFANNFYYERVGAEHIARQTFQKNGTEDITLDQIYDALIWSTGIDEMSASAIKELELQVEKDNILPIPSQIERLKKHIDNEEKVVLISDMYLPSEQIRELLCEVDDIFRNIPIYVSNEVGKTKHSGNMYREVAKVERVEFSAWTHYGDNEVADGTVAKNLGIRTVSVKKKSFMKQEEEVFCNRETNAFTQCQIGVSQYLNYINSDNGYRRIGHSYGGPILYSYVDWVIRTALEKQINRLYFVARDGWILKQIADTIIEKRALSIKTEYIYGSRKAWRMASLAQDNFDLEKILTITGKGVWQSSEDICDLLHIDREELARLLPKAYEKVILNKVDNFSYFANEIKEALLASKKTKAFLLEKITREKELAIEYLKQNVDMQDAKFAFVELSGTGYTQICLTNIIQQINPCVVKSFFLQADCVWEEKQAEFLIFHPNAIPYHYVVEMLCRAPHGQTQGYEKVGDKVNPILAKNECEGMMGGEYKDFAEGVMNFTRLYEKINGKNSLPVEKNMVDGYLSYVAKNQKSEIHDFFVKMPFSTYDVKQGQIYAPPLTKKQLKVRFLYGENPKDYKGASINFALSHLSKKDEQLKNRYEKLGKTGYGMWLKRKRYNDSFHLKGAQKYFYPFDAYGGKMILYAAGKVGQDYYKQFKKDKNVELVAWTDSNYENLDSKLKEKTVSPTQLLSLSYDYILVAVAKKEVYEKIKRDLINMGINEDKIFWRRPMYKWRRPSKKR